MPELDITGQAPNGKQPYSGGYSGSVSDNMARVSDMEKAQRQRQEQQAAAEAARPTNKPEYAKAEAQRVKQQQAETAAWRKQQQSDAQYHAKMDALHRQEIGIEEARIRESKRILQSYHSLSHRAAAPLTPSSDAAVRRAVNQLHLRQELHRDKYGTNAIPVGALDKLRTSLGSESNAFGVARTLRLGNVGQRAAYEHSYTELVRIERELRRIDSTLTKSAKFAESPGQQANLQRQRDALYVARERIAAGLSSNSSYQNSVGRMWGGGNLLFQSVLRNPVVSSGIGLAMTATEAPYVANQAYAAVMAQGQRYRNFRQTMDVMAMQGGFSADAMERGLMRNGWFQHVPGNALTEKMRAWGFDPESVLKLQQQGGFLPHNSASALRFAEGSRLFSMQFGMGLNEHQLAGAAGQAQSVFGITPEKFWQKLYDVEVNATAKGMNNSQVASGFNALLRSAAASGPASISGLSSYYAKMLFGGGATMRAGGAENYATAVRGRMQSLMFGGKPMTAMGVLGFLKGHGTPTNQLAFAREFHLSADQMKSITSGGGKEIWQSYVSAVKSGNIVMASEYLGNLLQNQPDTLDYMLRDSGVGLFSNSTYGLYTRSQAAGVGVGVQAGYDVGRNSHPLKAPNVPARQVYNDILLAARKYGIPADRALALVDKESGFQSGITNGSHYGLGQISPGALKDYNVRHGTRLSMSDMLDPAKNSEVAMWYFSRMYRQTGSLSYGSAYEAYHYGLGATDKWNETDLGAYRNAQSRYTGQSDYLAMQNRSAQGATAGLNASKYADQFYKTITDAVTAKLQTLGDAAEKTAKALGAVAHNATLASSNLKRLGSGNLGMMGAPMWVPGAPK